MYSFACLDYMYGNSKKIKKIVPNTIKNVLHKHKAKKKHICSFLVRKLHFPNFISFSAHGGIVKSHVKFFMHVDTVTLS